MNLVKASLPLMIAVSLGLGACNGAPSPDTSAALQAAGSKAGSTNDPAAAGVCKESTDSSGAPCKICFDSSGNISYDGCSLGGSGGSSGTGGVGSGGDLKCIPTTDASTGATCKTCYASDGSFTSYCAPPPAQGCVDASGKNLCGTGGVSGSGGSGSGGSGSGGDVKCVPATDPTTGAPCQTCYAADGTVSSDSCKPAGAGASCVAAPNLETGQICKVCSDAASGKLLFVDCPTVACGSTSGSTPPAK